MGAVCRDSARLDAFTVAASMPAGLLGPLGSAVHAEAIGALFWRNWWRPGVAGLTAGNGRSGISVAADSGTGNVAKCHAWADQVANSSALNNPPGV